MLAIHFPSSPIDARTPSPPTSHHADYYASAPLLAPPPANKRRAGPPKLSLQITSETRRTFSKSSIPPVSAGPLSPTSLSTQRNTQFNARRDAAPTSFSAAPVEPGVSRKNGNKKRRVGARAVGFAEGVEVIGYSVRWEDQQPRQAEEESSSSSSSEDDEEEVMARKIGGNLKGLEQMEALKLGRGSSRGYNWRMKTLNSRSSVSTTTTDEVPEPMSATTSTSTGGVGFGFGGGIGRRFS